MKARILILIALLAPVAAMPQGFLGRSEIVFAAGGMNYTGDLNNQSLFGRPNLAASVGLRYHLNNRLATTAMAAYGHIEGGNPDAIELRNLSFRSPVAELTLRIEFNFFAYGTGATDRLWTPFIFAGLGAFHFNPRTSYPDQDGNPVWVDLQPLGTEGQNLPSYSDRVRYTLTQMCLPFGLGVRMKLSRHVSVSAEYGLRATWTDYLDDVSTTYVGSAALSAGSPDGGLAARLADRSGEVRAGYVNAPGIKRGDDSLCDWYQLFTLTFSVNLDPLLGWTRSRRCLER
ncbi:MAG: DUF6089 family protein [Bacteroidales bacterium]|nr:DUF6089 family protein [Bacteroidales bacterium]